jgi:beta-lactamase regulating signal transducer with metallopeptidase domain
MRELTISSTALMIIVLTLRHFLKGRIGLRFQYAIWALVLVRLLVPLNLPESPISVLNAMWTDDEMAVAFSEPHAQAPPHQEQMITAETIDNAPDYLNDIADPQEASPDWGELLRLVWYAGMAVVGLCLLSSNLSFLRKLRKARIEFSADDYKLKVYVVENLPSPCLYGLLSPAVYLTPDVAVDKIRLSHVLAHELCHYRHGDHIWSALRSLCLTVYWFNPFVWLAGFVSRHDAELACDEATIRRLGEENRLEYGRTLIGLTCRKHSAMDILCCAMTDNKKGLQERIAFIVKKPKTAVYTLTAVLLFLAVAAGCTFTDAKPENEAAPSETPMTETEDSAQSPGVAADTFSHGYKIYDGNNPLSKEYLQKATWLTIINVDNLDFLRDAPNLTHIRVGTSNYGEDAKSVSGDLSALSGLTNLQSIILNYSNITGDIGSLNGLEKLQELYLAYTDVSGDISALSGLEKLITISLASDGVTGDLSVLSEMPALQSFDFSGKGITGDLSSLAGLPKLQYFSLISTPNVTGDISALKGMHLYNIQLYETNIAIDLSALSGISGLSYIDLASDNISGSLSDLSEMPNLKFIVLSGKNISGDLSALSGFKDLEYISLSTPQVTGDISMLNGCAKLMIITLDQTNVTADLSDLSGFTRLNSLTLSSPNVSGDLSDLSGLQVLSRITLESPYVTGDLSALSRHNNLVQLRLVCPNINGDLSALSGLTQLTYLNLSAANISGDISVLSGLQKLNYLLLNSTHISGDISALDGLTELIKISMPVQITGHRST